MMKRKYFRMLVLGITTITAMTLIVPGVVGKSPLSRNYSQSLIVSLFDGAYGDYDHDGHEDDVECYMTIQYLTEETRNKYKVAVHLTLPSGTTYDYGFFVNTVYSKLTFRLLFYNHARESGDYNVTVELLYQVPGLYYDTADIIFDPPTEQIPDTEPPSFTVSTC